MNRIARRAFTTASLLWSIQVPAHPGHVEVTPLSAFFHPMTGLDHLLVMVGIGLWAAHLGGRARWLLPLGFLVSMGIGAGLSIDLPPPGVEGLVAATVMMLGALLAGGAHVAPAMGTAIAAAFAFWHGQAHALEWPGALGAPVVVAFLGGTALLHGLGLLLYTQGAIGSAGLRRFGGFTALGGALMVVVAG